MPLLSFANHGQSGIEPGSRSNDGECGPCAAARVRAEIPLRTLGVAGTSPHCCKPDKPGDNVYTRIKLRFISLNASQSAGPQFSTPPGHKPKPLILGPFSTKTLDTPCYGNLRKASASKSLKTPDGPSRLSGVFSSRSPHEICNFPHKSSRTNRTRSTSANPPAKRAILQWRAVLCKSTPPYVGSILWHVDSPSPRRVFRITRIT
jgi:hypothetical protein